MWLWLTIGPVTSALKVSQNFVSVASWSGSAQFHHYQRVINFGEEGAGPAGPGGSGDPQGGRDVDLGWQVFCTENFYWKLELD